MTSLVQQLQQQALDSNVSIAALLRTAKVVASKLGLSEISDWVKHEVNGYQPGEPTVPYRYVSGRLKYLNMYHGWQPILTENDDLSERFVFQSVGELEDLLSNSDSAMMMTVPPDFQLSVLKAIGAPPSDIMFEVGLT